MSDKSFILVLILAVCGILLWDNAREAVHEVESPWKHNIKVKFMGEDKDIPADGELLIIDHSGEDTIFVRPAEETDIKKYIRRHEH